MTFEIRLFEVVQPPGAAEGHDRNGDGFGDTTDQVEVVSLHRAVTRDRLHDDLSRSLLLREPAELLWSVPRGAGSPHGPGPKAAKALLLHVDADRDRGGAERIRRLRDEVWVLGGER